MNGEGPSPDSIPNSRSPHGIRQMIVVAINTEGAQLDNFIHAMKELKHLGYGVPVTHIGLSLIYEFVPPSDDWALDFDNLCPDWEILESEETLKKIQK